jgi:hypothetical protein
MATADNSEAELERQRVRVEALFRDGWRPVLVPGEGPRVLSVNDYRRALKVIAAGLPTHMDPAMIRAVHDGARPGDLLPPPERTPFIVGVSDDAEVVIGDTGAGRRVAVLFSHQLFPGRRFGHRFPPPSSMTARDAPIWLKEEIETGALHWMMTDPPVSDEAGILWTTW